MRSLVRLLSLAFVMSLHTPALAARDLLARTLSADDSARLEALDEIREDAIAAARGKGDPAADSVLDAMLAGEPQPILGVDIRGDYRCRVAKLDGILPLVVYDWFCCKIGEDDLGYRLEKTSGSQRLSGHFVDASEKALSFYGAGHYSDETPKDYGDPERNIVGRFVKAGEGRYRLEMPLPKRESKFDILELERQ